ncbi:hypothetical protein [Dokdonella sp.]|uniref:hypothetical protein n=1 Tax=Dokdonella sp. TaxID=2291710 RepID=UPI001B04DD02|nr:hypothetical protein [Dokdonella sp.]MBO9664352.1 hypothetical protein [Dokdonella sp.]
MIDVDAAGDQERRFVGGRYGIGCRSDGAQACDLRIARRIRIAGTWRLRSRRGEPARCRAHQFRGRGVGGRQFAPDARSLAVGLRDQPGVDRASPDHIPLRIAQHRSRSGRRSRHDHGETHTILGCAVESARHRNTLRPGPLAGGCFDRKIPARPFVERRGSDVVGDGCAEQFDGFGGAKVQHQPVGRFRADGTGGQRRKQERKADPHSQSPPVRWAEIRARRPIAVNEFFRIKPIEQVVTQKAR